MGNFEHYFKDNLQDIDELPPSDGWKRIQGVLDDRGGSRSYYAWVAVLFSIFLSADSVFDRVSFSRDDAMDQQTLMHQDASGNFSMLTQEADAAQEWLTCLSTESKIDRGNPLNIDLKHLPHGVPFLQQFVEGKSYDDLSITNRKGIRKEDVINKSNAGVMDNFPSGAADIRNLKPLESHAKINMRLKEDSNTLTSDDSLTQFISERDKLAQEASNLLHVESKVILNNNSNADTLQTNSNQLTLKKISGPTVSDSPDDSSELVAFNRHEDEIEKDHDYSTSKKRFAGWSYEIALGTNYTMKKINPTEDIFYLAGLNNRNHLSGKNAGFQFNIKFRREINQKYALRLGASYARLRETTDFDYYNIIADSVVIANVSEREIQVLTYSPVRNNVIQNEMSYAGITVGMIRKISLLRMEHGVFADLSYQRVIMHSVQTLDSEHQFKANRNQFFIKGGLEKCFRLNSRYSLSISPFTQYSVGSVYSQQSLFSLRTIQFGVDVGMIIN